AVALLRLAVRDGDRVVGVQRDPRVDLRLVRQEVRRGPLAERRVGVRGHRIAGPEHAEADDERSAAAQELLARELLLVQETGHGYLPPFAITAAVCLIAVRIRGEVPPPHRTPVNAGPRRS